MMPRRDVIELWERRHDPNVAAAMIAIVDKYRRVGEPLPPLLERWHSHAIEQMLSAVQCGGEKIDHARWAAYGRALGMSKSNNCPTKFVSRYVVAMALVAEAEPCARDVRERIASEFGVSRNTADKAIDRARATINEGQAMLESALQRRQMR